MRLHSTVIDRLVKVYDVYGGHREQNRLRDELARIDLTTYTRQDGQTIIVLESDVKSATAASQAA